MNPRGWLENRAGPRPVGLETTLLTHGVPRSEGPGLARALARDIASAGATPALIGVLHGKAIVGMSDDELASLMHADDVPKLNTANLGLAIQRGLHGATTVSTTMELCAAAGVRVFATGGIGGVHKGYGHQWDVSADLAALTRFPVAVIASGVKSILDVESTREALETLGVPVVGYQTDHFPAFYARQSHASVDARFDDIRELGAFLGAEIARTGRGILVANPCPPEVEIASDRLDAWLDEAEAAARRAGARGRAVTPAILGALHEASSGSTLRTNIELVRSNARLAGGLAAALEDAR